MHGDRHTVGVAREFFELLPATRVVAVQDCHPRGTKLTWALLETAVRELRK